MGQIVVRDGQEMSMGQRAQTAGMARAEAPLGEAATAVRVRTEPGAISGWHHHGDHETFGYVIAGRLRFEFGPSGGNVVEVGPGEFFRVPARTIHREGNPGGEEQILIGFRVGSGTTVFNVDGPEG